MTEKKVLYLTFLDVTGKSANIMINNPKDGLTMTEVKPVGELIASKGVLESTHGVLSTFTGARLVSTQTEELA